MPPPRAAVHYDVHAEVMRPGVFTVNLRTEQCMTLFQRLAKPPSQIIVQESQAVTGCWYGMPRPHLQHPSAL